MVVVAERAWYSHLAKTSCVCLFEIRAQVASFSAVPPTHPSIWPSLASDQYALGVPHFATFAGAACLSLANKKLSGCHLAARCQWQQQQQRTMGARARPGADIVHGSLDVRVVLVVKCMPRLTTCFTA